MFYVYIYRHPLTREPFYVGKGSGNRIHYHVWGRHNHHNRDLSLMIQQVVDKDQLNVLTEKIECQSEQAAYEEEKRLIKMFGRRDLGTGTLLNKSPGGEGFGNTGTKWTPQQRFLRKQSYRKNPVGTGFTQYTLFGERITDYDNSLALRDAGYTITQIMTIRQCCKGQRFSVREFRWSYNGQSLPEASTTRKRVEQFSRQGHSIASYESVSRASQETGINGGDIASVARGNTPLKTAGGFVWRYA